MDEFSRFTWIHFIKHKSDYVTILNQFITYVERQFNHKIKCIRSDNAKKLIQGDAKQLLLQKGIMFQSSCPETPQQNGVVERKHRHLLETTRALYHQSHVPLSFWFDCILCAVHLINRMPLTTLQNLSPYEKLFSKKPSYDYLKSFGFLCFASTLKRHRHKFLPRADKSIFLGYSVHQKGYKLYNLTTKTVLCQEMSNFTNISFLFNTPLLPIL